MGKFIGFSNFKENIKYLEEKNNLLNLKTKENNYYINDTVVINCIDNNIGFTEHFSFADYSIALNGNIYNKKELKKFLEEKNIEINNCTDSELILKLYINFETSIFSKLNGNFSFVIWDGKEKQVILVRDHFGTKPLFYTILNNTLIFSTEIKSILKYPGAQAILDSTGISELFGIGPAHTPGTTYFKNIFEIKPSHFAIWNQSGLTIKKYWKLENKPHTDNLSETCDKIQYLIKDAIYSELETDKPFCTFLSGGLDSSIISKFSSDYCKDNNLPPLDTYSVDYVDNDKNFVKSDFQPNSDNYYIDIMKNKLHTNHHKIVIDTPELALALEDAMVSRDMPGMADVDSSLLLFCRNVRNDNKYITLTGECADEIFGGYPWFFREDRLNCNTFPWSVAFNERQSLLNDSLSAKINIKEYIDYRYKESLSELDNLEEDSKDTALRRKISHLTLNWFMQTLIDRSERVSTYTNFEIRVPFCDYRLVEYAWNIPWELKALNGREKGLLRYTARQILPEEIVDRKKSPYPKTHNPTYLAATKTMLTQIYNNPNAPVSSLINRDFIKDVLDTDGKNFVNPWFGQLMTGPQFMAYICQINMWLEKYNIKLEI